MVNIISTLITDRTQADVDRARYLNGLWDPRALQWRGTPQERAEWEAGPRGAYCFADMNRVTQAAAYLIGQLEALGYHVDTENVIPAYSIQVNADPASGGAASGGGVYYKGETVTVTAQAGEKYDFAGWMEAGKTVSEDLAYTFVVERSHALTAVFALKKFQVMASVDPSGAGEVTGAGTYDIDTQVTVVATAGDGYVFTRWTENGQTVSDGPEYTFTLDRNRSLSAVMTKTYVISVTASDGDGGTVSGGGTYLDGQTVTVSAVAGDGYEFTGWTENGAVVSTDAAYSFAAGADRALVAVFAKTHVITLLVDPAGGGTAQGGGTFPEGKQVTVTAAAGSGYRFLKWLSGGEQVSASASYTFTVTGDQTLTAVFEEVPVYIITATIDPAGAGTVTGAGQYKEGETCTLKATASGTNQFVGWKDGDTVVSTSDTYSFTVTGDVTLTAAFKAFTVVFTAVTTPYGNGGGLAFGNGKFLSSYSGQFLTSTSSDGKTWSGKSISTTIRVSGIAFGNGKFCVTGTYQVSGSTYRQFTATSADGLTFSFRYGALNNSTAAASCLSFAHDKFFAHQYTTQYFVSTDGVTFASYNSLPSGPGAYYDFAYGDGAYVAVGSASTAAYGTNGTSWSSSALPSAGSWYSAAYGNGMFIAANGSTTSSHIKAAKSTDGGKTWTAVTLPANVPCRKVIFAGGMFFIASYTTAQVFYSSDGTNWNTATIPGGGTQWKDMAYGNGVLVITQTGYKNAAYAEIG